MTKAQIKAMFIPGDIWHVKSVYKSKEIANEEDLRIKAVRDNEIVTVHQRPEQEYEGCIKIPTKDELIEARPGFLHYTRAVNFDITLTKQ